MIQLASLAFWLPLEIYQWRRSGIRRLLLLSGSRTSSLLLSEDGCLGLERRGDEPDPWDHVHVTTWNFLPFLLRRVGLRRLGGEFRAGYLACRIAALGRFTPVTKQLANGRLRAGLMVASSLVICG